MSDLKSYKTLEIDRKLAKPFCASWHYSKTLPGCKHYFGFFNGLELVGVAGYGTPAMRNQAKCYFCDIELRRLCLIDDTPKNAESRFISMTLKILKRYGYSRVLSLADPEHGHQGIIYRAANFTPMGQERGGGSRLIYIDGEEVHSRTAWAKYGTSGIKSLQRLLGEGRVQGRNKERKMVYVYQLNDRRSRL